MLRITCQIRGPLIMPNEDTGCHAFEIGDFLLSDEFTKTRNTYLGNWDNWLMMNTPARPAIHLSLRELQPLLVQTTARTNANASLLRVAGLPARRRGGALPSGENWRCGARWSRRRPGVKPQVN